MARAAQNTSKAAGNGSLLFGGPRSVALPRMVLILSVFILVVLGFVMVYSSSTIEAMSDGASTTHFLTRQLVAAALGLVFVVLMSLMPYYVWLGPAVWGALAVSVCLLLLTALIGTAELGAQRWISIGPVNFQPSELAKPAFVLMMAYILYKGRIEEEYDLVKMTMMIVLCVLLPLGFLYVTQSDLGTTVICLVGILVVVWLSDVPLSVFVAAIVGLLLFGLIAVVGTGYRADRLSFLNPQDDYYGSGYQLTRSFYAFAEGGLFGVGLGNSSEKYLYLPEAETDFIFAIIGEELGLVGAALVIVLFLILLWAGLQIARNAPDLFGTMIAGACTVMLVFQAFLNIACVVGMLPTTGKPLPFISSGGSSLIGSFLLVGVILQVSFASGSDSGVYERRRNDLMVVRSERGQGSERSNRSQTREGTSFAFPFSSSRSQGASRNQSSQRQGQSARAAARNRRGRR